jgi:hypothetical protein
MRHRREAGDVPPIMAAYHMGCASLAEFEQKLPALLGRGFPAPDETTGNFDLDAIKAWRRSRHPQLFPSDRLLVGPTARDARDVVPGRLARIRGG